MQASSRSAASSLEIAMQHVVAGVGAPVDD